MKIRTNGELGIWSAPYSMYMYLCILHWPAVVKAHCEKMADGVCRTTQYSRARSQMQVS
jgi:hypothetical protein